MAAIGWNAWKCLEKSLKGLEWLEMAKHGHKCMEMDVCLEMAGTGWTWLERLEIGKITGNGWNLLE